MVREFDNINLRVLYENFFKNVYTKMMKGHKQNVTIIEKTENKVDPSKVINIIETKQIKINYIMVIVIIMIILSVPIVLVAIKYIYKYKNRNNYSSTEQQINNDMDIETTEF